MGLGRKTPLSNIENLLLEPDIQEAISGGVCYSDSSGVNLQVWSQPFSLISCPLLAC